MATAMDETEEPPWDARLIAWMSDSSGAAQKETGPFALAFHVGVWAAMALVSGGSVWVVAAGAVVLCFVSKLAESFRRRRREGRGDRKDPFGNTAAR